MPWTLDLAKQLMPWAREFWVALKLVPPGSRTGMDVVEVTWRLHRERRLGFRERGKQFKSVPEMPGSAAQAAYK